MPTFRMYPDTGRYRGIVAGLWVCAFVCAKDRHARARTITATAIVRLLFMFSFSSPCLASPCRATLRHDEGYELNSKDRLLVAGDHHFRPAVLVDLYAGRPVDRQIDRGHALIRRFPFASDQRQELGRAHLLVLDHPVPACGYLGHLVGAYRASDPLRVELEDGEAAQEQLIRGHDIGEALVGDHEYLP